MKYYTAQTALKEYKTNEECLQTGRLLGTPGVGKNNKGQCGAIKKMGVSLNSEDPQEAYRNMLLSISGIDVKICPLEDSK